VQVWINSDTDENVAALARALEQRVRAKSKQKLLAFMFFINPQSEPAATVTRQLEQVAKANKIERVGLAYLPGPREPAVGLYKINTGEQVRNTVFVYRSGKVAGKFVNLEADPEDLRALDMAIQKVTR
jgi:hypothetical protein